MKLVKPPDIGLGHLTFLDLPPLDLADLAARTGYRRIGLRLHPETPHGPFHALPPGSREMRDMRRLLAEEDLQVQDIDVVVIDAGFQTESVRLALDSAAELGARRLNVCADDTEAGRLRDNFTALCELAATIDMAVDIECMRWRSVNRLNKCVSLLQRAGRDNAGVLIDALHVQRCGGSPEQVGALPAKLVRSAQLCDAPTAAPEGTEAMIAEARSKRLPPGEGQLPLRQLIAALPQDTLLSVEVPMAGKSEPEERARRILDATKALFSGKR